MLLFLRVTLHDKSGNQIDTAVLSPDAAIERARAFMVLHGTDPEHDGKGAEAGSITFEPVWTPRDPIFVYCDGGPVG